MQSWLRQGSARCAGSWWSDDHWFMRQMYDDISLNELPVGAYAYAGYVDGSWANFPALKAKFPGAHLLDITVFANANATCLDVESGDATIAQVFGWFKAQAARHVYRPVIYTQAGNLDLLYATMKANGFARGTYRVWSAHYTNSQHICGPGSCGYSLGGSEVDGTQFTDVALGRSLDESVLVDKFFDTLTVPPPPQGEYVRQEASGQQSFSSVASLHHLTGAELLAFNVAAPFDEKNRLLLDAYAIKDPLDQVMPAGFVFYVPA